MHINELLRQAVEREASDLHITVGVPPTIRLNGLLTHLNAPPLKPDDTSKLVEQILGEKEFVLFKEKGEIDYPYSYYGFGRFRVNAFHQRGTMGMAIRVIKTEAPQLSSLGFPDIVARMALRPRGIIFVTGPAGSGKTTTLAAMIELINNERNCHVITLENPVEYLHTHKKAVINQREIGSDSDSFPAALRAALRQDPDVIMVGEMNDPETVALALTAAEAGHLVLAALHTTDAPQTIWRTIDYFPPSQQNQARIQLANSLVGVISQRLLPRKDGKDRVAAVEFLVSNSNVRNLIREGRIQQIFSSMQNGVTAGMRTMDDHLQQLLHKGYIHPEDAMENAADRVSMSRFLNQAASED